MQSGADDQNISAQNESKSTDLEHGKAMMTGSTTAGADVGKGEAAGATDLSSSDDQAQLSVGNQAKSDSSVDNNLKRKLNDRVETADSSGKDNNATSASGAQAVKAPKRKRSRAQLPMIPLASAIDEKLISTVKKVISALQIAGSISARILLLDAKPEYKCSQLEMARIVRYLIAAKVVREIPLAGDTIRGDRALLFLTGKPLRHPIDISGLRQNLLDAQVDETMCKGRVDLLSSYINEGEKSVSVETLTASTLKTILEEAHAAGVSLAKKFALEKGSEPLNVVMPVLYSDLIKYLSKES